MVNHAVSLQTMHVQTINSSVKNLVGQYDLEIDTLPCMLIASNSIEQSKTKTLVIPYAGLLEIMCLQAGDGCIMVNRGNGLEWVCNLSGQTQQSFYLQPGNYLATWRAKSLRGSICTTENIHYHLS